MPRKPTIEALCKKYKNEDAHSRHVADLALQLWDALSGTLDLPASLRPLLRAAALLHDIGYDRDPEDHQAESSRLIRRYGVADLAGEQAGIVAAAVLLHRPDFAGAFGDPVFGIDAAAPPAKMLGAILRIADGLDCGHCQNAEIQSVNTTRNGIVCVVSSQGYGGNVLKAGTHADLWRQVFARNFKVEEFLASGRTTRFAGIIGAFDTINDAARKLLCLHYRLFIEQRTGMLEGKDGEPLHSARLAIRRYRAVLKLFAPYLEGTVPRVLDSGLATLCRNLSSFRDVDVWQSFLSRQKQSPVFKNNRAFGLFCAAQSRARTNDRKTLAAILEGSEFLDLMREMARFPRTRLYASLPEAPPLVPLAARKLVADFWNIAAMGEVGKDADPEKVHLLRKRCRAARYRAEFFEPLLGKPAGQFAVIFKELSDALGELHDADCSLERLKNEPAKAAQRLVPVLEAVKKEQRAVVRKSFAGLSRPEVSNVVKKIWNAGIEGMPVLYIVRHATAADGGEDRLRPLTDVGIAEATVLGKALALLHCRPGIIASSPLVRALSTTSSIKKELSFRNEIQESDALKPDTDIGETIRYLSEKGKGSNLCVGHLPHLDDLIHALLRSGAGKKITLAKASACCIAFPGGKIAKGAGEFVWYFPPKKLQRLVDRF